MEKPIPMKYWALVAIFLLGCEKKDPSQPPTARIGMPDQVVVQPPSPPKEPAIEPARKIIIFVGQSNTPCVSEIGIDAFLSSLNVSPAPGAVYCRHGGTSVTAWQKGQPDYETCVRDTKANGGIPMGVVYVQGENEAATCNPWKPLFESFARDFRTDIGYPAIPVVWERLNSAMHEDPPSPPDICLADVRQQMMSAMVTPGAWVDLDGVLLSADGVHYPSTSCSEVGSRFGRALAGLLK